MNSTYQQNRPVQYGRKLSRFLRLLLEMIQEEPVVCETAVQMTEIG